MIHLKSENLLTVDYYNDHAVEYFINSSNIELCCLYDKFLSLVPSGGTILDAGCGSGRDAKHFLSLGYKVIAIDSSKEMVRLSSEFAGQETLLMDFYHLNLEQSFDGIWALASLLHIPKRDIQRIISNLASILKEGGVFYMSFKEGEGERFEGGRFFNDYNEYDFRNLIENQPLLKIEDLWLSLDFWGREQRWITALLRKT